MFNDYALYMCLINGEGDGTIFNCWLLIADRIRPQDILFLRIRKHGC